MLLYVTVQQLTSELQAREARFNSVQDRGEALLMERHPASNIIRVGPHFYSHVELNLVALCCTILCILLNTVPPSTPNLVKDLLVIHTNVVVVCI